MSNGCCSHCGAPYPRNQAVLNCEYCGCEIEERFKAVTSFPTTLPLPQIDTTGEQQREVEEDYEDGGIISKIIPLIIAIFMIGIILPPAMQAIAKSALTSVNVGVSATFVTIVPIAAVIGTIAIFIGSIAREHN